jgi:hypothetical protein
MRFQNPVAHLKSHLSKDNLEQMRNIALTTAGFSAATIVLLAQLKGTSSYSAVALWASIISMVVWLFGFVYVNAYLLHGERVYKAINVAVAGATALLGYAALFVSVVATVWQLSVCAGVALSFLGVALAVVAFVHNRSVERHCNESDA